MRLQHPRASTYILGAADLIPDVHRDNNFRWAVLGALGLPRRLRLRGPAQSGVNTVPAGQAEAARSIGLTFGQSLRHVILPQAFRGAIAPLGSTLIALIKNTTVASVIGVAEAAGLMTDDRSRTRPARPHGLPHLRDRLRHPHPARSACCSPACRGDWR